MIKFKDVAHLYLGCKLQTKEGIGTFNVLYTPGNVKPHTAVLIGCYDLVKSDWRFDGVKPILKSFLDLKGKDAKAIGWKNLEVFEKLNFRKDSNYNEFTAQEFLYLTSHGYDLFNLIENGEAIEENH